MKPLAVSLGDPAGIGPEIVAAAWTRRGELGLPPFFVVGGERVLGEAAEAAGLACPTVAVDSAAEAANAFGGALPVLSGEDARFMPGNPSDEGAALALHSLAGAARCALLGEAAGVVTAPVGKAQLARVGFEYPGQTEFLAEACGMAPEAAVMMLAGPSLRTVPVTVHCALAEVPVRLSTRLIVDRARVLSEALARDFGIESPRIAVAGLNPHAGESGRFGHEERDIIQPAIDLLHTMGIAATGPHPADALFTPRARATYDAALAMYHDQALVPLKALDFDEGVNVTLGLPIVRTSPDHGTAFDIAGRGIADPGAMCAAIRMAGAIARRRASA